MERVWGGRRLETLFGKKLPADKKIGESWEIVDRPEAQSVVRQGPWQGKTLHELWCDHRAEIFGETMPDAPRFPIFAKLLDAEEKLSLQVHPGATVPALGGESKTEMWYLRRPRRARKFTPACGAASTGASSSRLCGMGTRPISCTGSRSKPATPVFVPSGRLHAIGAGNLLIEIQQNSDTTFRLFDWNRVRAPTARRARCRSRKRCSRSTSTISSRK